jgi:rare lipoprotein A
LEGSDDAKLLASLRVDGAPATLDGLPNGKPVMVASAVFAPVEKLADVFTPAAAPKPPRPHVAPAPEPVAAAAEPEPMRPTPVDLPTPPARPFDLGAVPGAAIPVAFTGVTVLPPRRPSASHNQSANNALYFADNGEIRMQLDRKGGPFARLSAQKFLPFNETR